MPKGPQGQRRPANVIGAAIKVAKIATGEIEEKIIGRRKGGLKGGKARSKKLTAQQRSEIARIAAQSRWKKSER